MGMFDWVNYAMPCPQCGVIVDEFQSKGGPCGMETIDFWEVDNFYAFCDQCGAWIEFKLKDKRPPLPISAYSMTVKTRKDRGLAALGRKR